MNIKNHIAIAERLARLMDSEFRLFNIRFGLDPIIGLIPGIGDMISFALGAYMIWIAVSLKLPQLAIIQMVMNLVFDLTIGAVPVIGDITDVFYKANIRNLAILKKYANPEEGRIIG